MAVNPYAPGAGTAPPVLVGRDYQLAIIASVADLVEAGRRPQHMVLTGLRGVGKTVLLKTALRRLRDRGWMCGYYEVRRDVDAGTAIGTIVVSGAEMLPLKSKLSESVRKLRASIGSAKISGSADGTLALEISEKQSSSDPYLESLRLFDKLGKAAQDTGVGVALCIDELQTLRRKDATTLLQALEAHEAEDSRVLLIGAGLPTTPVELAGARTYAERFRYEPLDDLQDDEARRAVIEPAKNAGVHWTRDAAARVIELAQGYPYFLQLYASEAWEAAAGAPTISLAHVHVAEPRVAARLDSGLYAIRYQRASVGERLYIDQMATLMADRAEQVRSSEVANALGKGLTELSAVRDRLIRKGVIHAPGSGLIAFSVPGFRDYVQGRIKDAS